MKFVLIKIFIMTLLLLKLFYLQKRIPHSNYQSITRYQKFSMIPLPTYSTLITLKSYSAFPQMLYSFASPPSRRKICFTLISLNECMFSSITSRPSFQVFLIGEHFSICCENARRYNLQNFPV